MGTVYKAYDKNTERFVAIKVIGQERLKNQRSILRFKQEAIATARLNHPTITKVYDCGLTEDEQPYLVMEFAEGKVLSSLIAEEGQLPLTETLVAFIAISDGLAHAHENKVLHRDLKPSNIMLNRNGSTTSVKILDFGIAKILQSAGVPSLHITHTGELLGSPLYMSPEQAKGRNVDERSDLYSLGCTMYEALTGGPPHIGDSPISTLIKRESTKPLSMGEASLGLQFPQELEDIVAKLLKHDPDERYQSALELKFDLLKVDGQSFAKEETRTEPSLQKSDDTPIPEPLPKYENSPFIVAGVVVCVIALVVLIIFGWKAPQLQPVRPQAMEFLSLPSSDYDKQLSKNLDDVELFDRLTNGNRLRKAFKYDEAAQSYKSAIQLCLRNPVKYARKIPDLRIELGWTYMLGHKWGLACQQCEMALPYYEKTCSPNDDTLPGVYSGLGECLRLQYPHPSRAVLLRSLDCYDKAEAFYRDRLPKYTPQIDSCLNGKVEAFQRLGDMEQVKKAVSKLLEFREVQLGPSHASTVVLLGKLAQICRNQNKPQEAIVWDKRWVDVYKNSPLKDPDQVDALAALASDYYTLAGGKDVAAFKQAGQIYERVLKLCQKDPVHYEAQIGHSSEYLGTIDQFLGQFDPSSWQRAEYYNCQALKIYRRTPNFDKAVIARILIRNGYVQIGEGRDQQGAATLTEAIKMCSKIMGPHSLEVMQTSWALAEALRRSGKYSEADPYYKQCLALTVKTYGRERRNTADVLSAWCENSKRKGDWHKARPLMAECLELRKKILGPKNPETQYAEATLHQIDDYLKSHNSAGPAELKTDLR
jgi:serine/threonine protein kinase